MPRCGLRPPTTQRSGRPRRSLAAVVVLAATLAAGFAPVGLGHTEAALGAGLAPLVITAAPGDSAAEPVPLGQEAVAGPLRLGIEEVLTGPEATDRVIAASPVNDAPREGVTYVLVNVRVANEGDRPIVLDSNDFALTAASGFVRRFVGAQPPEPAIDGTLEPGARREGWVVLAAPTDEQSLLLLYDSLSLPGVWADQVLALQEGAAIPDAAPATAPNDVGIDLAAPASFGDAIITADWQIELLDVARGAAVFDLVDYRTGALGAGDAVDDKPWLALRLRITNVRGGGEPAFLPPNAFTLVDEAGDPIPDVMTLTPPRPDASGAYYPGAVREGWVAFELPADETFTVRFLPYAATAADPDPRYLAYG